MITTEDSGAWRITSSSLPFLSWGGPCGSMRREYLRKWDVQVGITASAVIELRGFWQFSFLEDGDLVHSGWADG